MIFNGLEFAGGLREFVNKMWSSLKFEVVTS
jgi:hypothetical protein